MALSATGVFQVDNGTNGDDTHNAGYYNPAQTGAGTDYSIIAPLSCTDLAIQGGNSAQVSSSSIGLTTAHVGNGLRITAGSGFTAGLYEITAVASGIATLDRSAGTAGSTSGTARVGGALASPGQFGGLYVAGNLFYLKNTGTAYSIGATFNVSGGWLHLDNKALMVGYQSDRSLYNADPPPTLRPGAINVLMLYFGGSTSFVRNLSIDNPGANSGCTGLRLDNTYCTAFEVFASDLDTGLSLSSGDARAIGCYATGCGTFAFTSTSNCYFYGCVALGNFAANSANAGFLIGNESRCYRCIGAANNGYGFYCPNTSNVLDHCVAYGNLGTHGGGFSAPNAFPIFANCAAVNNATLGFDEQGFGFPASLLLNCAGHGNGGGNTSSGYTAINNRGFLTLSGDPFADGAGGDFSINDVSGAGAVLRAAAWPTSFPGISTTNFLDVGAAQHQDAATPASTFVIPRRRKVR